MTLCHKTENLSLSDDVRRYMEGNSAEECNQNINDPSSRLSRLERPAVGKHPKRRRTREHVAIATDKVKIKVKGTGNGRNLGKLAQLMDMPLDVFFEITEHLEPLDILQLSRVSKHFRLTFASKYSRHIWVAARRNIFMPECSSDLTELQYASLMFEQTCQACGSRAYKVDYSLRLRLCGPCFETNVKRGSKAMKLHYMRAGIPDLIFTLIPRSSLQYPRNYSSGPQTIGSGISDGDANTNRRHNAYYVPELEMVIKRYQALTADPISLENFVKQQQTVASQMMKSARLLTEWVTKRKDQKKADKNQKALENYKHMSNREASIEAKLLELGWEKKDFPSEWDSKWRALVKQPHKLTPQIWRVIQPKLIGLLEDHRGTENRIIIRTRRDQRERELEPFWDKFVLSYSWDYEKPWALPRFVDACDLPVIDKMLAEDESNIQVTAERWQVVVAYVPDEMTKFADRVMHDVVRLLKVVNSETNKIHPTKFNNEDMDPSIFEWASSLLSCGVSGCKNLFTFPEILEEEHVTPYQNFNFQDRKWPDLLSRLRHEPEVFRMVSLVLKTLELPDNTPLALFHAFDRKFICLCGNPRFQSSMDFQSLIRHLADENITYETQVRTRRKMSDSYSLILNNDHDLTGPQPCFALLPFSDLDTLNLSTVNLDTDPTFSAVSNTLASSSYFITRYCRDCWILNTRLHAMRSDEEATYHMKAKHLKEVGYQDALTIWELKRWKRKHPGD